MTPAPERVDPREVCLVCKQPPAAGQPGAKYVGEGGHGALIEFYLHDLCGAALRTAK